MNEHNREEPSRVECQVCGRTVRLGEAVPAENIQGQLREKLTEQSPGWTGEGHVCKMDLLIKNEWQKLLEIQQMQIELISEIAQKNGEQKTNE